jgi:hypothetical protein
MKIATALAPRPPEQVAAAEAMRIALAEMRAELDDAADYADHFATAFFLHGSVTLAAAFAHKELHRSMGMRQVGAALAR